jgi:hypothetical protein
MQGKVHQQLRLAYDNEIRQIWVFNVGDIKPMELPLTFALALAWNIDSIQSKSVPDFYREYSIREFGPQHATETAQLLLEHDSLMALRRQEHTEPYVFSVLNYREADTVVSRYKAAEKHATNLMEIMPPPRKSAFFQLVLHPIKASRINTELRVTQAKNKLYGLQRRNSTNSYAQRVLQLFDEDFDLSEEYHSSPWFGDKWKHIVSQPHYGYIDETWHAPTRDLISGLSYVQRRQNSGRIAGQLGVAVEGHAGIRPGLACEEIDRTHPSRNDLADGLTLPVFSPYVKHGRYFEIFSRGSRALEWSVTVKEDWIGLSPTTGCSSPSDSEDCAIEITVDWSRLPLDYRDTVEINVRSNEDDFEIVRLPVDNRRVPIGFSGFVETEGCVSLTVGSMPLTENLGRFYQHLPFIGRCGAGGITLSGETVSGVVPYLEYPVWFFSSPPVVNMYLYFTTALEVNHDRPFLFDVAFDDVEKKSIRLLDVSSKGSLPTGWENAVKDNVWVRSLEFPGVSECAHILKYRPLTQGLVLEKVVLDVGGLRESYLGPPCSFFGSN